MRSTRFTILLLLSALGLIGCAESWDIGHSQTLHRGGWNIHLIDISDDSMTQANWGTSVTTGGHTIVISNGVRVDGNLVASGATGELIVKRGNGTVTVTVNGREVMPL